MKLAAIDEMNGKFPHAELFFIESGGDNLAATFRPEWPTCTIDVSGEWPKAKKRAKGGPRY